MFYAMPLPRHAFAFDTPRRCCYAQWYTRLFYDTRYADAAARLMRAAADTLIVAAIYALRACRFAAATSPPRPTTPILLSLAIISP